MATYYKYAERNAEDYVDWGAIGKTMSDTLLKEQQNRDKMKADIDKASREFGETLMNAPQGESVGMTNYALEFADNAQQYQLMQLKNLKSGKLLLKDYLVGRENLKQGTSDAFGVIEKYQEKYGEYMQRFKDGDAAGLETYLLGEVEGFGNLTSSSLYINPSNGQVSAGKRVPRDPSKPYDPQTNPYTAKMSDNPNDFRTLTELNFALSSQIDKFDAAAATDEIIDSFAKTYETITMGKRGAMTKVDDIRQLGEDGKEFVSALDTKIKAMFETNPLHALSTIQDFLIYGPDGEEITLTRDPSEANEHTILLKANPEQPEGGMPVADFSSESGKKLLEYMREKMSEQVIAGLNRKVAATAERAPIRQQEWQAKRGDERKRAKSVGDMLSLLRIGNAAQVKEAEQYFVNTTANFGEKRVIGMDRTDDGVVVKYAGGNTQDFNWKEGSTDMTNDEWLRSASSGIASTDDYQNVVSGGSRYKNKGASTAGSITHEITIANPDAQWNTLVSSATATNNLSAAQELGKKIGLTVEKPLDDYGNSEDYWQVIDAGTGKVAGSNLRSSLDIINVIDAAARNKDLSKFNLESGGLDYSEK